MEVKKPISHIVAGSLITAILIVFSMLTSLLGVGGGNPGSGWLSYLIIIVCIVVFVQLYAKANHYRLGFKDLFHYGFKTTTMITLLFVLFLGAFSFIMPQLKEQVIDATRQSLEKQSNLTEDSKANLLAAARKYYFVVLIGSTMFLFVLTGAVASLIGAAITKKNPQDPLQEDNFLQPQ